uniref:Uncharacterized protein n=1 Tax=Physcomitrium patens TaxID=3218 RepID=A0A2K1KUI7_PHYPA|nr:hypothetical protein PHYPA_004437 [Physcomitrium patens]
MEHLRHLAACSYGRVGLRRQIKVLVRKGVGSNPTVNMCRRRTPVALPECETRP